jgi:hypothetical protein
VSTYSPASGGILALDRAGVIDTGGGPASGDTSTPEGDREAVSDTYIAAIEAASRGDGDAACDLATDAYREQVVREAEGAGETCEEAVKVGAALARGGEACSNGSRTPGTSTAHVSRTAGVGDRRSDTP